MTWDWAIDTFRALIVAAITWVVIHLRKKTLPFLKTLRKFTKLVELTDQLQAELAIVKSQRTAMNDILSDPFFILNEELELEYANAAYAKMGGMSDPRDLYGHGYMRLIPDEDKPKIERLNDRLRDHPHTFEGKVRFQNVTTGEIVIAECRTALFYDSNKKILGSVGRLYIIGRETPK